MLKLVFWVLCLPRPAQFGLGNMTGATREWGKNRYRDRHTENLALRGSHSLRWSDTQLRNTQEPQHVYYTQHKEGLVLLGVLCRQYSQVAVFHGGGGSSSCWSLPTSAHGPEEGFACSHVSEALVQWYTVTQDFTCSFHIHSGLPLHPMCPPLCGDGLIWDFMLLRRWVHPSSIHPLFPFLFSFQTFLSTSQLLSS